MNEAWKMIGEPDWNDAGCSLGDDQIGGEASVRWATIEPHNGLFRVVESTYGVVSVLGFDENFDNPVGPFYVVEQHYAGTCTDLQDVGGTEENADYDYQPHNGSFDTVVGAEERARELAHNDLSPNDYWPEPWAGEV